MDAQVEKWLKEGIIEVQQDISVEWNNPLLVVDKKNSAGNKSGDRVYIDPRPINAMIKSASFPLPRIRDLLEKLKGAEVFTALDLKSSFHHFPIVKSHRNRTTFTWNGVQYQFVGSPFGLKTIPSIFQMVMSKLPGHLPFVIVYIDDIVIFSENFEEHPAHARTVLEILNEANLKLNQEKCRFAFLSLTILGYRVSKEGISVAKEKLVVMNEWKVPTSGFCCSVVV